MPPTYALSDLHLHDDDQRFLFTGRKQTVFEVLAAEILAENGEMVLAGDVFDLTGIQPPGAGLATFLDSVLPLTLQRDASLERYARQRPVGERLAAIADRFPGVFSALAPLAAKGRLHIIPGNHDCELRDPEARTTLARLLACSEDQLGLESAYSPPGTNVLVGHGNGFDPSNLTDHTCANPGAAITSALYCAVVPALRLLDIPPGIVSALTAVRPEEKIVDALATHLGAAAQPFLNHFVRLLDANGYFDGILEKLEVWAGQALGLITLDAVRNALRDDTDVSDRARAGAEALRRKHAAAGQTVDLVVLGHTHVVDLAPGYVNLGTWIDAVKGFSDAELASADRRLPVLRIDAGGEWSFRDVADLPETGGFDSCRAITVEAR